MNKWKIMKRKSIKPIYSPWKNAWRDWRFLSKADVEAVLGKMVKRGIITIIGNGRGIKYLRKE